MSQLNTSSGKKIYTIAVDFDGTIVTHEYPRIGTEIEGAVEALKKLLTDGHRLILWTVRERELLTEALQWCEERGLVFYAINSNYPEETLESRHFSRKLQVDIFIDDRSLGRLPSWDTIYRMISSGRPFQQALVASPVVDETTQAMMSRYTTKKKKRFGLF